MPICSFFQFYNVSYSVVQRFYILIDCQFFLLSMVERGVMKSP